MTLNLTKLFTEHGVAINLGVYDDDGAKIADAKGLGVPVSQDLLDAIGAVELNSAINAQLKDKGVLRIVAGDMLTAIAAFDKTGQPKLGTNGQPKREGGYLKLGAENDLTLMIPRAEPGSEPYALPARNTRQAAATLLRMAREARHEVIAIDKAHDRAMESWNAAQARGEITDAPVKPLPKFLPETFRKFDGFVAAAEAVIHAELANAFSTTSERTSELMDSLKIRNERRNVLSPDELNKVAQMRSLREQIGALAPDHAEALKKVSGSYRGTGEAAAKCVEAMGAGRNGISFGKGVPAFGDAATLLNPLLATFTTEKPSNVWRVHLSGSSRRLFEQDFGRYENTEIADIVRPRIENVMNERMPGYTCDVRFFTHKETDLLMINDLNGVFLYAMDSAARTATLDLAELNRAPTPDDVPSDEKLEELRSILTELTFDNGGEIDFFTVDDEENDDIVAPDEDEDFDFGR